MLPRLLLLLAVVMLLSCCAWRAAAEGAITLQKDAQAQVEPNMASFSYEVLPPHTTPHHTKSQWTEDVLYILINISIPLRPLVSTIDSFSAPRTHHPTTYHLTYLPPPPQLPNQIMGVTEMMGRSPHQPKVSFINLLGNLQQQSGCRGPTLRIGGNSADGAIGLATVAPFPTSPQPTSSSTP
jgi:hypothetical protein